MAMSRGKKIGLGILVTLVVLGAALGIYVWIFSMRHKPEYGKKHDISKKEQTAIVRFENRLKECRKEVFTHKDFPYKPSADAIKEEFKKGIRVMIKEVRSCLQGQKSDDGKGYSVQMQGKQLEPIIKANTCADFARQVIGIKACATMFEALITDKAGFKDPLDDGDEKEGDKKEGDKKEGDKNKGDQNGDMAPPMAEEGMKAATDAMGAMDVAKSPKDAMKSDMTAAMAPKKGN